MQLQLHKQTTLSVMPWCLHMKAGRLQQLAPCGLERLQVTLLYQHNLHKAVSCHSLKIAQCARFTGLRPSAELGSRHRSSGPKQSINLMSSAAASSKASILFMAKLICKAVSSLQLHCIARYCPKDQQVTVCFEHTASCSGYTASLLSRLECLYNVLARQVPT